MSGHGREVARVYGTAAALHLPLTWVLTKLWGPLGAALSTAGAQAAAQAVLAWRARATLGARTPPF
jgi:O-antigen/teichoic acid export membrane protein